MMISEPRLGDRPEQPYVGIRTVVRWEQLPTVIPQLIGEVFGWLTQRGIAPNGAPFIRYHVINMESELDIAIGVPVAAPVEGNGRVFRSALPAGRYATVIHVGPYDKLVETNARLIDWAGSRGIALDRWNDPKGDAFAARYEAYLTNPQEEPDLAKHETEVGIKVAD
jgi:effector-binding domain-containing protein